jgi:hypothetical protein
MWTKDFSVAVMPISLTLDEREQIRVDLIL